MKILMITIAVMVFITSACSDTFLVGRYEHNYFWGNTSDAMYEMLCPSGALKKVLSDTRLSQAEQESLYAYNCIERSSDKIRRSYASMTELERNDIKNAFKKNNFAINVMAVYDSECATSGKR